MQVTSTISVRNLVKRIGRREILHDISFEVYSGEIFGFLGPNGAGKTTTIRILTGLMKPTSGSVQVCGYDIMKDFTLAMSSVGAIVETPEAFRFLTGWQNLKQCARVSPSAISDDQIRNCVDTVGLSGRIHEKVQGYSLGMKQRLGLAGAILSSPSALILDEPTNGMDPRGVREIRDLLLHLARDRGISVFISTHLLLEAQAVCDRVAIIDQGSIVSIKSRSEISDRVSSLRVELTVANEHTGSALTVLQQIGMDGLLDHGRILIQIERTRIPFMLKSLLLADIDVYELARQGSALEDYFITSTQEALT